MKRYYLYALLILFSLNACDTSSNEITEASEEKQFVWNGLNHWYFWQGNVPDLADNRFTDEESFYSYLNDFQNEEILFNSLLFQEDDFSWFIENYVEHEESRQGITKSFGFRYGLVRISQDSDAVFGYVQYVVPDSPADDAGLKRGDVFTRINGTTITTNNFSSLLQSESYVLTLADPDNNFQEIEATDPINSVVLQENPIHAVKVIEADNARIGYLVLNAFRFNFHEELNDAFGVLLNENIDELVLDLRYNSGGALITSAILAGMISGLDDTNVFSKLIYNEKRSDRNVSFPIYDEVPVYNGNGEVTDVIAMNQLNLNRLYILTGFRTASASETIVNGLRPYLDEVILIGDDTRGKDEGSITVYDNPPNYSSNNGANQNHMRAMQPIVFKIFNAQDQDYPDGFSPTPNNRLIEFSSTFLGSMPELGDESEPLLARALELITGNGQVARMTTEMWDDREMIIDSQDLVPFSDDVYLLPGDIKRLE
ncbi:MAG: peptidase S41 [Balneolaceae bacterium]|nr:MAG: peptidase S41 [Balneolaceae bacterium]